MLKQLIRILLSVALCLNSTLLYAAPLNSPQGKYTEDLQAAEEFSRHIKQYEDILDGRPADRFPLDDFFLLQQKVTKKTRQVRNYDEMISEEVTRFVNWWDLKLEIYGYGKDQKVSDDDKRQATLSFEAASNFKPSTVSDTSYNCTKSNGCHFRLTSNKETDLNKFTIPTTAVAVFGQFIVFIRPNSYHPDSGIQKLSFIDLESFNHHVGNEDIPVFDIPIKASEKITSLTVADGFLKLNRHTAYIHPGQLADLSQIYSTVFNLSSNMVDPNKLANTLPLVDSIFEYLEKVDGNSDDNSWLNLTTLKRASVDVEKTHQQISAKLQRQASIQQEKFKTLGAKMNLAGSPKDAHDETTKRAIDEFIELHDESGRLDKVSASIAKTFHQGQTLTVKLRKLRASLISPKPNSSNRIKNAIATIMAYAGKAKGLSPGKLLKQLANREMATKGMIAAAGLAFIFPESYALFLSAGLDVGSTISGYLGQTLTEIGEAFWRSAKEVSAIFWSAPSTVNNNLLANGQWAHLAMGLGALAVSLAAVLGAYHTVQHTYHVLKDWRSDTWEGLVKRQEAVEAQHLKNLGEAEKQQRTEVQSDFSDDDEREIEHLISIDIESRKTIISRKYEKTKKAMRKLQNRVKKSSTVQKQKDQSESETKATWKAFSHIYFSIASYSKTVLQYTGIWNSYSALRYSAMRWGYLNINSVQIPFLKPTPVLLASRLLYPKMFSTIVEKERLPSKLNGGLTSLSKSLGSKASRWIGRQILSASPEDLERQSDALKKAEDQIHEIEGRVIKLSFNRAIKAAVKYMKDDKELNKLFNSNGIINITDADIRKLNYRNKTFIRTYFERVYEDVMHQVLERSVAKEGAITLHDSLLKEVMALAPNNDELHQKIKDIATDIQKSGEVEDAKLEDLKKLIVTLNAFGEKEDGYNIEVSDSDLEEMASKALENESHFGVATAEASRKIPSKSAILTNIKHEISGEFDPEQDGSMKRYAVVQEKRKKPLALARAVRAEISNLVATLPLDIAMLLLLTAGITEGIMKPLQPEMFGPNSIMYLSQYSFYGSLVAGVFSGVLANSWVKLQQDARHDDAGNFGDIPRDKDAKRSFLSWFWKQTNQRDNSLWKNWKEYAHIVWHNIPAYLQNAAILNLLFIGFFDLDALVVGLATTFTLPIAGFTMKIEQGFEKSAYYDAKIFPEKYLTHPRVQKYIQGRAQSRRHRFNLVFDLFRNFIGTVEGNAYVTPTETHPNRAFSRAVFGTLLAEKIINTSQELADKSAQIPVVGKVTSGLQSLCEGVLGHKDVIHVKHPLDIGK